MVNYLSFRSYFSTILLILSIISGGLVGYYCGGAVPYLKPMGDIFIHLIFTIITPFIFFSIVTAIARTKRLGKTGQVFGGMALIFIITSLIVACLSMILLYYFPLTQPMDLVLKKATIPLAQPVSHYLASLVTVDDFSILFSHQHILALIIFSILTGLATSALNQEQMAICMVFLESGEVLFARIFSMIMLIAPIGFFAYFAVLINELGPSILHQYAQTTSLYYAFGCVYFVVMYSLYAYIADSKFGLRTFWKHITVPAMTSIATCSSAASIPATLSATKAMRVPAYIADTVIPIGSMLHKEGSIIGGVFKVAFLFSFFQLPFTGIEVWCIAIGVSMLVGMIMGAIPSGGLLGELFILTVYGFPPSALLMIAAISVLIDPLATLLNVTGNSISSLLVWRVVEKKIPQHYG